MNRCNICKHPIPPSEIYTDFFYCDYCAETYNIFWGMYNDEDDDLDEVEDD
jgi:hypothetical protein